MGYYILAETTKEMTDSASGNLQTLIATAGSITAIATLLTFLLAVNSRIADHPRPNWAIVPKPVKTNRTSVYNFPISPIMEIQVSNVGTGDAHMLSIIGVYCNVNKSSPEDSTTVLNEALITKGTTLNLSAVPSILRWSDAGIFLTWSEPRTNRKGFKRHSLFIKLPEYYDQPAPTITTTDYCEKTFHMQDVDPLAPENHELLKQVDNRHMVPGKTATVSSNWLIRHFQYRKLRKAGWRWPTALPR